MPIPDDYSPISQGDTGSPFTPQFLHADNSPVNLSGATITMKMQQVTYIGAIPELGEVIDCSDTAPNDWIIDDESNGRAHRQWSAEDVATAGIRNLYIVITIGGLPVHADDGRGFVKQLVINPAP
jgi:hypothetical protein